MSEHDKLRQKYFEESKFDPANQKYGLFSYSGTLAISKTPYFEARRTRRNKDGSVDAGPRNFITSTSKTGKSKDALFSLPEGKSELYSVLPSYQTQKKEKIKKVMKVHGELWRPAGITPDPPYPFQRIDSPPSPVQKKSWKDGVPLAPKNFVTSPMKKGQASTTPGITFAEYPKHLPDPYELKSQKRQLSKGVKIASHDGPFKSIDFGLRTFAKDEEVYGSDVKLAPKKRELSLSYSYVKHDMPFKFNGKGVDCFGQHPEYMSDPLPKISRKKPDEKIPWKTSPSKRSTPTPSISFNTKNLKSEFSSVRFYS